MKKSSKGAKTKNEVAQPASPVPARPPKTPSSFRMWVGIGMSAALLFYNSRPQTYTVCSGSEQIYTVDPLRPRVECISVKGARIVDVGTAGKLYLCFGVECCLTHSFGTYIEDLTKPVNYLSWFLPESITSKLRIGPPLKVMHLDRNAVLVPGLAGTTSTTPQTTRLCVLTGAQMPMPIFWKTDT